jgi:hypothetical protein
MPCAYHIDSARGAVFIRAWGALNDREVTTLGLAVRADPRFDPMFVRIENLLDVTDFKLTTTLVQSVGRKHQAASPPRRAFVVGSDVGYGLIRMLELYADAKPEGFLVCRDLAEGLRWVGLDAEAGWPDDPPSLVVDSADNVRGAP